MIMENNGRDLIVKYLKPRPELTRERGIESGDVFFIGRLRTVDRAKRLRKRHPPSRESSSEA